MEDETFFVRARGKVSGPFDISTLQKLIRRGMLSRVHEISADRSVWSPAGEFEDLFPIPVKPVAVAAPTATEQENPDDLQLAPSPGMAPHPPPAHMRPGGSYFYTQFGSTVGPVPIIVLRSLAENGTLRPDDLVWRENAETGAPAWQMPMLAPLFSGLPRPQARLSTRPGARSHASALAREKHQTTIVSTFTGIIAGGVILAVLNLPWLHIQNQWICWWDLYRAPGADAWTAFATALFLASIALLIISPIANGTARGVIFVSFIAIAWFLLIVAVVHSGSHSTVAMALVAMMAISAIMGVCAFRALAPDSAAGRALLGIFSGVALFAILFILIYAMQSDSHSESLKGSALVACVLSILAAMLAMAAGVMGLVSLKPTFTPSLNTLITVTALGSLVLCAIVSMVAVASASHELELADAPASFREAMVEIVGRVLVLISACLAITYAGVRELLTATHKGD